MSLERAIQLAGEIPPDAAAQPVKKAYSELLSRELAFEVATILSAKPALRQISPCRPPEPPSATGAEQKLRTRNLQAPEKYFLGGFGKKKIDVSLAGEQEGLLLSVSIKTITSRDARTHNYNKNFKNRFGDLCAEATSIHMRSPYTVVCGLFAMPVSAACDNTPKRKSTAERAVKYLRSISGRQSHDQAPERFEQLTFMLFEPQTNAGHEALPIQEITLPEVAGRYQPGERYRLFDVWERDELSIAEYADRVERLFLARNPFLED